MMNDNETKVSLNSLSLQTRVWYRGLREGKLYRGIQTPNGNKADEGSISNPIKWESTRILWRKFLTLTYYNDENKQTNAYSSKSKST